MKPRNISAVPAILPATSPSWPKLGKNIVMNSIVYIVGLVVIVIFVLGFFGLR
jgi:hypothetical protein